MTAVRRLGVAFGFLTRFPSASYGVDLTDLSASSAFFPVVGLALGSALTGLALLGAPYLPPQMLAVLLVGVLEGLTGGLHVDGLADVFDGLGGGGRDPARTLAIMQDSRIGAHGAAAVALVLVGKVFALSNAIEHRAFPLLIAFPAVARWAVVPLIAFFPCARATGLGEAFHRHAGFWQVTLASMFVASALLCLGPRLAVPAGVALLVALAFGRIVQSHLNGLTGDAYGAAIEIAELTFLMVATGIRR